MKLRIRWTRRKTILAAALLALLTAGGLAVREWSFVRGLPPEVRQRMPWHCTIPWGVDPEVRAAIEDCYSPQLYDRLQACHDLANMGPKAAPAAPYLVALLADLKPDQPEAPGLLAGTEDWPIIGPIVRFFTGFGRIPNEDIDWRTGRRQSPRHRPGSSEIACQALGEIGPAAVPALTPALNDEVICIKSAVALGNIGDRRAGDALAASLDALDAGNPRRPLSVRAAAALCQLRDPRGVDYLEKRLQQVGPDPGVEGWIIGGRPMHALLFMGPQGWAVFLRGVKSDNERVRLVSALGLAECLRDADLLPPETVREMSRAVAPYLKDLPNRDIAVNAMGPLAADDLAAMLRLSDDQLRPQPLLFEYVLFGLFSHDRVPGPDRIREWAAVRLGEMGDRRAVEPLLALADGPPENSADSLIAVYQTLADLGHPRGVEWVRANRREDAAAPASLPPSKQEEAVRGAIEGIRAFDLKYENADNFKTTLEALMGAPGVSSDKRLIEPLWGLVGRLQPPARPQAPIIWRGHTAREAISLETPVPNPIDLSDESSRWRSPWEDLRALALGYLAALGDAKALAPLLATAADGEDHWWLVDLRVVAKMGPAAVPPLEAGLADPSPTVRAKAAALLVTIDDPQAMAALRKACGETDTACIRLFEDIRWDGRLTATTEALIVLAEGHRHRYVREWAMDELAYREDPRVVPALRRIAANDVCASIRESAWWQLERLAGEHRPESAPAFWQDEIRY